MADINTALFKDKQSPKWDEVARKFVAFDAVDTSISYRNPTWLTTLDVSKITNLLPAVEKILNRHGNFGRGPAGPTGPTGQTGPTGPAGPSLVSGNIFLSGEATRPLITSASYSATMTLAGGVRVASGAAVVTIAVNGVAVETINATTAPTDVVIEVPFEEGDRVTVAAAGSFTNLELTLSGERS